MINPTQQKILEVRGELLNLTEKEQLIEQYLLGLETKLNIKIDRNKNSNFYILAEMNVDMGLDAYNLVSLINLEMLNFFDENKFDGYLGSDYMGCRQALMQLGYFIDVKFYNDFEGQNLGKVQTILLPKNNVDLKEDSIKNKIAECMHAIFPVGTVCYEGEGAITTKITAHTGQEFSYSFFEAGFLEISLWVEYIPDYENYNISLDYAELIKTEINNLYLKDYGLIDKDFILNDFLGIVRVVKGLRDLKYYRLEMVEGVETKGDLINENIVVSKMQVLKINKINIVGV